MTKTEFLAQLRLCLAQMPPQELEKQIAYYDELLSDMTEDGMSELEATAQLGEPAKIAQELLTELPLGTLVKTRVKPRGGWTALNVLLLVLGAPVWLPLLLALGAVLLAIVITLWALVIAAGAVVLALAVSAGGLLGGAAFGYLTASPMMLTGLALIAGSACVLSVLLLRPICRGIARLSALLAKKIKSLLVKKEVKE